MRLSKNIHADSSPFFLLITLVFYALMGLLICFLLGSGILFCFYGSALFSNPDILNYQHRAIFQLMILAQSVGLFLLPPVFLYYFHIRASSTFFLFRKIKWNYLVMVLVFMIVSSPFLEWSAFINSKLMLPDFLHFVEEWMYQSEQKMMETTKFLLSMKNISQFAVNLFLIAFVPAVCEELMFRGAIQGIFRQIMRNKHLAIWCAAIFFSAIHLQFYGFLPRMLLGAFFGYLYIWTGSLYYSMIGHFFNNAYAVCIAWYAQYHHRPFFEDTQQLSLSWYWYPSSILGTLLLIWILKKKLINANIKELN